MSKSHSMFDFAYKLQLHYNIHRLVFTICMAKTIKMKIPLGTGTVQVPESYMQKETYHEK